MMSKFMLMEEEVAQVAMGCLLLVVVGGGYPAARNWSEEALGGGRCHAL